MTSYDPPIGDFCDILKDYSLSGLGYLRAIGGKPQADIMATFGSLIENDAQQIEWKFSEAKKGRVPSFNFIPMPKPSGTDFLISFFVPRFRFYDKGKFHCAFCLVFWMNHDGGRTVSFRFEPADVIGPHSYPHLQLSQSVKLPNLTTSLEKWAPESYPAFPFRLMTPLHFFAAVAMAVHGYSGKHTTKYLANTVKHAMQTGSSAERGRKVVLEIQQAFGN